FPLAFHDVHGSIRVDNSRLPEREITIDLDGRTKAGDSPAGLHGTIKGHKDTGEINLDVTLKNARLDDHVDRALRHCLADQPKSYEIVRTFLPEDSRTYGLATHPLGTGHLLTQIRRKGGETQIDRRFIITFEKCRALYDLFPYPVEDVSGVLDLR